MKTFLHRLAAVVIGCGMYFGAALATRATITVESTNSFGGLAITPRRRQRGLYVAVAKFGLFPGWAEQSI